MMIFLLETQAQKVNMCQRLNTLKIFLSRVTFAEEHFFPYGDMQVEY